MLTRIRDNLAIVAVLAACIFAAYAYISNLQADIIVQQNKNLIERNTTLITANENQSLAIKGLMEQRIIDEQVVDSLNKQRELLNNRTLGIRNQLREIAKNDEHIQKLLSMELPSDIIRLLEHGAADGYSYGAEKGVPASKSKTTLSNTFTRPRDPKQEEPDN